METYIKVSSLFCVFIYCVVGINCDVVVNTNSGKVAGKQVNSLIQDEKYYSFMGIPYAEAPVGKLRFMPPKPHPGWEDVLDATKEKKPCAQFFMPTKVIKNPGFCGDEDCLRLSIHTPKLPDENNQVNLPVIVFLYNEYFRWSYNGTKDFGPDFFMNEDVIVIYTHHRLGALGFLSFQDDLLPGNNALRDIILSLQWIKDNIKNFGGDPNSVTLMGQAEGAVLADLLLHVPKAKRLFHKIILQSGTAWQSMTFAHEPRQKAIELTDVLEVKATTSSFLLKMLTDIAPEEIATHESRAVHADEGRGFQVPSPAFAPVVEHEHPDALITKLPENSSMEIEVPILIGYNSREVIEFMDHYLKRPQFLTSFQKDFVFLFPIRTGYHFNLLDRVYKNALLEMRNRYFEDGTVKISRPADLMDYMGFMSSIYAQDYAVRKYTNVSEAAVYYYTFDYSGELNYKKKSILKEAVSVDGTWGASLGDQLCYLFVCNPIRKTYKKVLAGEYPEELKVLQNMVRMWTNFAKSGNPTPPNEDFIWTPATKENKECLVITDELEVKSNIYAEDIQFWDDFLEKYGKMAVDGVVADKKKDEL